MAVPTEVETTGAAGSGITSNANLGVTQTNDIIIETIALTNTTTPGATIPTGFTLLSDVINNTNNTNSELRLITCWKRASGAEADPVWSGLTGYRFIVSTIIRGCRTTDTPVSILSDGVDSTGGTAFTTGALGSTGHSDCMWVVHVALPTGSTTVASHANSTWASVTEEYDIAVVGGAGCHVWCATGTQATAGAGGTYTATISSSATWCYSAVALRSTTSVAPSTGARTSDFFQFF